MPSGAKKRKAAKKKKEQQANHNNPSSIDNSNPQGNDDPKSQDERESDGGEVGSPASQDHRNQQNSFNEENEESEKRETPSFVSECKPVEGAIGDAERSPQVGGADDTAVKIGRELSIEQDIESKDFGVEQVESAKESHDGDDKSSSSSGSDEESHVFDKKCKEESHNSASDATSCDNVEKVIPEEKPPKEANGNSVVESISTIDLVTPVVLMSEVAKHMIEGAEVENLKVLDVVESIKENEDKLLLKFSDDKAGLLPEESEGDVITIFRKNVGASTNVVSSNVNGNEKRIMTALSAHIAETSVHEENIKDSEVSDVAVIGNEGKMFTSSGSYSPEASDGADKAKDSETSERTETQPLVSTAPRVAQRTSWMNCCGLFEVFTGSK